MSRKEIGPQAWKELLSEIRNGNVIPIIGPELSKIEVDGKELQLNEYLLNQLIEKYNIKINVSDFTQLNFSREWKEVEEEEDTCMQYEIKKLYKELNPTASLYYIRQLLKIKEFKLILSTTFDNLAELAMNEKYGAENVKVLNYELRKNKDCDINEIDILDKTKVFLFHMFGKLGDIETSYVLTEKDMLKYMLNWINISSSPKNLINYMQNKYLLVLGCDYPNWLFKFFLHAIKYNFENNSLNVISMRSVVADFHMDDGLDFFLSRIIKTRFHNNPEAFIDELLERYQNDIDNTYVEKHENDVFISYAHEDEDVAYKIVNELKNCKISVWFDKNKDDQYGLTTGDKFDKKIKQNICNCKMFVPILSKHVLRDKRFFRKEWSYAFDEDRGTYKKFIFPIIIHEDLDLSNEAIADEFKELHCLKLDINNIKDSLQELIRLINKDKRISLNTL